MKKLSATIGALLLFVCAVQAQRLPDRKATLETLVKVNDYFMNVHPDPRTPTFVKRERSSNLWTRAVYFEGLMALYAIYPDEKYFKYAYEWADFHGWAPRKGTFTRNADDYCCGQTYIDMYNLCRDEKMIRSLRAHAGMLVGTPQVSDWWWVDAIQMGMPYLAKMARATGDARYYKKAHDMYLWTRDQNDGGLLNKKEGLWWRDPNFNPPYKAPNGQNCYWSRGNGWAYAALARVLDEMNQDFSHSADRLSGYKGDGYELYIKDFQLMSRALKACQRQDGFWNADLLDESDFGGKETTGTALFVYGMAWGVRNGLLDSDTYLPVLLRAWQAITAEAIHKDGYIGYVQGTGKEPKDGQPVAYDSKPDFDDYGTGCVLLAGTEVYKLIK